MTKQRIPSTPQEWKDAVDDAVTYIRQPGRQFGPNETLTVVDDIVLLGNVEKSKLMEKYKCKDDKMRSHLALVTMGVHEVGKVPKGGWYSETSEPVIYHVNPKFAEAWKAKRRLSRED